MGATRIFTARTLTIPTKNPSWRLMEDGNAVCTCRPPHSVFDVVMFLEGGGFDRAKIRVAEILGRRDLILDPSEPKGVTLAQLAEAKGLPIEFLCKLGWFDLPRRGKYHTSAIGIPYRNQSDEHHWPRIRVALGGDTKKRFKWRKGDVEAPLYGAWQAAHLPSEGYAILCEGESDAATLWLHGFPALGLPGAGNWNEQRHAPLLDGVPVIFVIVEPDTGGNDTLKWVARSSIRSRAKLVRMPTDTKDPSALYLRNSEGFVEAFRAALDAAEPLRIEDVPKPATGPLAALIDRFNAQYAVVNEAGIAVVYEQTTDPTLSRKTLIRITFPDLKKFYQNELVTVTRPDGRSVTKTAAEWWLNQ